LKVSENINDVIDWNNVEIDSEGFNNYLEFGFAVYQQSPVKNVKFLAPGEELTIDDDHHNFFLTKSKDLFRRVLSHPEVDAGDVLDMIKDKVRKWEKTVKGHIVLPLSGGYDSRLLASMLTEKEKVRAFTYGISDNQKNSYEVVYARKAAEILGLSWQQISLSGNNYTKHIDDWIKLYGCSTHAHGMYHMEFYDKFKESLEPGSIWLSGIFGDAWAGKIPYTDVSGFTARDLPKLSYSHGLSVAPVHSLLKSSYELREHYWQANKEFLRHYGFQMINIAWHKLILISYIMRLPREIGFDAWTPFLDEDVVLAMLSIKKGQYQNRLWQERYFQERGLDVENMHLQRNFENTLDLQELEKATLNPLNTHVLREVLDAGYVEYINKTIAAAPKRLRLQKMKKRLLQMPKAGGALRRLGIRNSYHLGNEQHKAYISYLIMKPIEQLLIQRGKN
jgi:asparagine synthetase B (glutamine-hydrolysing)